MILDLKYVFKIRYSNAFILTKIISALNVNANTFLLRRYLTCTSQPPVGELTIMLKMPEINSKLVPTKLSY